MLKMKSKSGLMAEKWLYTGKTVSITGASSSAYTATAFRQEGSLEEH